MKIFIRPDGDVEHIYDETLSTSEVGHLSIERVSLVEPDLQGEWSADLSIVGGPKMLGYERRSQAIQAETRWMEARLSGS